MVICAMSQKELRGRFCRMAARRNCKRSSLLSGHMSLCFTFLSFFSFFSLRRPRSWRIGPIVAILVFGLRETVLWVGWLVGWEDREPLFLSRLLSRIDKGHKGHDMLSIDRSDPVSVTRPLCFAHVDKTDPDPPKSTPNLQPPDNNLQWLRLLRCR